MNFPAVAVILRKLVLLGLLALINILTSRTKKPPPPILWEMHTNDSSSGHKVTLFFYSNKKLENGNSIDKANAFDIIVTLL